jgi:hypothetical protein
LIIRTWDILTRHCIAVSVIAMDYFAKSWHYHAMSRSKKVAPSLNDSNELEALQNDRFWDQIQRLLVYDSGYVLADPWAVTL